MKRFDPTRHPVDTATPMVFEMLTVQILHEHDRTGVPYLCDDPHGFIAWNVHKLFNFRNRQLTLSPHATTTALEATI